MSMFGAIDASASGLTAERLRMDVLVIILLMPILLEQLKAGLTNEK